MLDKAADREFFPFDKDDALIMKKNSSFAFDKSVKKASFRKRMPTQSNGQYSAKIGYVKLPCDKITAMGMASARSQGGHNSK